MMEKYTLQRVGKRNYHRNGTLSKAEVMVIIILFHNSGYRCLKHFYLEHVCKHLCYLLAGVLQPLLGAGEGGGHPFGFVCQESSTRQVYRHQLRGQYTTGSLQESAHPHAHDLPWYRPEERGRCSMGWFFGFKLHLICNERGELLSFMITPGDIDDRKPLDCKSFVEFIYGKFFADKGYIGKELFQRLFVDGIQMITKLKTVNDELKNIAQVEHSRHRSFDNFIVNILGALAAYCFFPKKPCIVCERMIDRQLELF